MEKEHKEKDSDSEVDECEYCGGTGKIEKTDEDGQPSGYYKKCFECNSVDEHDERLD